MDGLWDPAYYQESEDIVSVSLPYDVIEETAINEKSCVEVLEILTSTADADIVEHEEVLMDLLSQLAHTDELFSDMFIRSLTAKIDFLDSSIRKLKDDDKDFLSTRREPAESIYEILKSLFCCYLQKKDVQFAENNGTASSSCACLVSADNQKKQVGSSSIANQTEEIKTGDFTSMQKQRILPTIVKVEEEHIDYPQTSHVPKYSPQSLYSGSKKKEGEVPKYQINSPIIIKKDILQNRSPRCNSICPKPSLETQGRQKHQLSIINSQPHDESTSLEIIPYDKNMSLATIPCVESLSLAIVPYDERMSLETVLNDETMSLATVPYEESNEEQDFPPGYPRYSTRTYTRRKKPDSPLQTGSSSHHALMPSTSDRAETYSDQYMEYDYTVSELRAMAKQQKLKGYYKLRKAELAQFLGIKLIEGRSKQLKKSRETQLVPAMKREP